MITNNDRAGYFGGSDTAMVLANNRGTKSFRQWWAVKLGEQEPDFKGSIYTEAGNRYEHPILKSISENIVCDGQIIIEKLKLRVNYDGWISGTIYEVKTHRSDKDFEISKAYWGQAQVEMYAYQQQYDDFRKLYIASYPLYPDEYTVLPEIDFSRIKLQEVKYDKSWVKNDYLPRLKELARYLKKGKYPS